MAKSWLIKSLRRRGLHLIYETVLSVGIHTDRMRNAKQLLDNKYSSIEFPHSFSRIFTSSYFTLYRDVIEAAIYFFLIINRKMGCDMLGSYQRRLKGGLAVRREPQNY